jgi:hypothetical protein
MMPPPIGGSIRRPGSGARLAPMPRPAPPGRRRRRRTPRALPTSHSRVPIPPPGRAAAGGVRQVGDPAVPRTSKRGPGGMLGGLLGRPLLGRAVRCGARGLRRQWVVALHTAPHRAGLRAGSPDAAAPTRTTPGMPGRPPQPGRPHPKLGGDRSYRPLAAPDLLERPVARPLGQRRDRRMLLPRTRARAGPAPAWPDGPSRPPPPHSEL